MTKKVWLTFFLGHAVVTVTICYRLDDVDNVFRSTFTFAILADYASTEQFRDLAISLPGFAYDLKS